MKRVQKQFSRNYCELKGIAGIYGVPHNSQHQGAVKVFNRTVRNLLTS